MLPVPRHHDEGAGGSRAHARQGEAEGQRHVGRKQATQVGHQVQVPAEGNTRRAIDIQEGEKVDAGAFKALVKAAVAQNGPPAKKR